MPHDHWAQLTRFHELPRLSLAYLPTPVERLDRLSKALGGPTILMKRDDQTGLALGGNKARKLEFLMADALSRGADTIITAGAAQSNHCRQTAAAATRLGLRCELVLGGQAPDVPNGNLLLDHLFGATIHWTGMDHRVEHMNEIAEQSKRAGRHPYVIPYGGSNAVGATGFAVAFLELMDQMRPDGRHVDWIIVASSSGGTQAGMVVGAKAAGFTGQIIGVSIDKGERGNFPYEEELAELSNAIARHTGLNAAFSKEDFVVEYGYLGGGYGVVGPLEADAIRLVARHEGIILDPVYTGRAMGAFIDLSRKGRFSKDETVLFWHTGGAPAVFHYALDLMRT